MDGARRLIRFTCNKFLKPLGLFVTSGTDPSSVGEGDKMTRKKAVRTEEDDEVTLCNDGGDYCSHKMREYILGWVLEVEEGGVIEEVGVMSEWSVDEDKSIINVDDTV